MTRPEQLIAYESDGLTAFRTRPLAVAVPESADEVIALVRYCHSERVPFVARGIGVRYLRLPEQARLRLGYKVSALYWLATTEAKGIREIMHTQAPSSVTRGKPQCAII